jgi:hypothetical protein
MFARHIIIIGSLLSAAVAGSVSTQPAPKEKERPVIKCELKVTGKIDGPRAVGGSESPAIPAVDGAEILITNQTSKTIDIGGTLYGAQGNFDLMVTGPDGKAVKTEPHSSIYSPFSSSSSPVHFADEVKPGKSHRIPVGLLVMVPEKDRVAGKYKVKATFKYDGKTFESNEVEVNWAGKKE